MSANLCDSGSRALSTKPSSRGVTIWHMLFECLRAASGSLATAPLRSFLTMLGIAIGVASVIAVVSMVQGLASAIGQQFQFLGSNVYSVRADTSLEDALRGKRNHLHLSDLAPLRANISGVQHLTPTVIIGGALGGEVHFGAKKTSAMLMGTTSDYQDVHRNYTRTGRFLNDNDDQARRRIVVLGAKVREELGLPADPSGAFIQLNEEWCRAATFSGSARTTTC
jgi:putative ABC transport system permease protein